MHGWRKIIFLTRTHFGGPTIIFGKCLKGSLNRSKLLVKKKKKLRNIISVRVSYNFFFF